MAIGWVLLIAYGTFMLGFAVSAIFSITKIAVLKRGWCRHKGDCSELLAGEGEE